MIDGLNDFLKSYPAMSIKPTADSGSLRLKGSIRINHQFENYPVINKNIRLEIEIPKNYPASPPVFRELDGYFPISGDYHVNHDQTLCLASPFQLKMFLALTPDFNEFFKHFFIPFAYAVCLKIQHNIDMVFGELSHGVVGEIEDLEDALGVNGQAKVLLSLRALSTKKRIANKRDCPCGCGKILGKCSFHFLLNDFRGISRAYYKKTLERLTNYKELK